MSLCIGGNAELALLDCTYRKSSIVERSAGLGTRCVRAVAIRYQLSHWDVLIVASALLGGRVPRGRSCLRRLTCIDPCYFSAHRCHMG